MAVLTKDEFFNEVNGIVGTNTSDEALKFIENMTDTYNDLEKKTDVDPENWEEKYHQLDESWKQKYKNRFFSTGGNSAIMDEDNQPVKDPEKITMEDLFSNT